MRENIKIERKEEFDFVEYKAVLNMFFIKAKEKIMSEEYKDKIEKEFKDDFMTFLYGDLREPLRKLFLLTHNTGCINIEELEGLEKEIFNIIEE